MKKAECTACGAPASVVRGNYVFTECGLRNVVLQGVEITRCAKCGNDDVVIPRLNDLMRTLAFAVVSQPYRLQGEDVRFLRKYLNMTQAQLAELLDIHKTNLSKWENNEDKIGEQSDRLIRAVSLALGEGLKEKMELVIRSFPQIQKSRKRPGLEMNPDDLSFSFA
jgi:putative zinc finger/helix-turn-helix YgiT family protein